MPRNKKAMGISVTDETKSLLKRSAKDHYDGNISMVVNIALKEWFLNNGYLRKTNPKAGH